MVKNKTWKRKTYKQVNHGTNRQNEGRKSNLRRTGIFRGNPIGIIGGSFYESHYDRFKQVQE
jgi:hypothetical protein